MNMDRHIAIRELSKTTTFQTEERADHTLLTKHFIGDRGYGGTTSYILRVSVSDTQLSVKLLRESYGDRVLLSNGDFGEKLYYGQEMVDRYMHLDNNLIEKVTHFTPRTIQLEQEDSAHRVYTLIDEISRMLAITSAKRMKGTGKCNVSELRKDNNLRAAFYRSLYLRYSKNGVVDVSGYPVEYQRLARMSALSLDERIHGLIGDHAESTLIDRMIGCLFDPHGSKTFELPLSDTKGNVLVFSLKHSRAEWVASSGRDTYLLEVYIRLGHRHYSIWYGRVDGWKDLLSDIITHVKATFLDGDVIPTEEKGDVEQVIHYLQEYEDITPYKVGEYAPDNIEGEEQDILALLWSLCYLERKYDSE